MATTDDILQDVQENSSAVDSAVTLLTNLSGMIAAAGTDPAKLDAIRAALDGNTARLADAVVANTPAAPTA